MCAKSLASAPDGRLFQPERAWLERYDTTLLSSRLLSEFSWESYDDDSDILVISQSLRWGVPLNDDITLGFQAVVPFQWTHTTTDDAEG